MTRLPETTQIIAEVERLSGRKVIVQEDPELKTLALVKPARGELPFHLITYRPNAQTTNYLIAFQLGFLLRTYALPEAERWVVGSSPAQRETAIRDLRLREFPPQVQEFMVHQLITQLRSHSVGMRIDQWILESFPALAEEQNQAVRLQLADIERALQPETRDLFPKRLVDANSGMNAAFATVWGQRFGEPRYALPFAALGYTAVSNELLAAASELPDAPSFDRALVEKWAEILHLSKFFSFLSY